jgi:hypothetical protein
MVVNDKFMCMGTEQRLYSNTVRNLSENACVVVSWTTDNFQATLDNTDAKALYMILRPEYMIKALPNLRYTSAFYNVSNPNGLLFERIALNKLKEAPFVRDAFRNKAMSLVHPRLGFLLQTQANDLWRSGYYDSGADPIDRITLLTLQAHAALRRYNWTKNRDLAAEVYTVDPKTIADELRAPYFTLPGETFNTDIFMKEFMSNQVWAGGEVRYASYSDPKLNTVLPTNPAFNTILKSRRLSINEGSPQSPNGRIRLTTGNYGEEGHPVFKWFKSETYKTQDEILIPSLPEEDSAKQLAIEQYESSLRRSGNSLRPINIGSAVPYNNEGTAAAEALGLNAFALPRSSRMASTAVPVVPVSTQSAPKQTRSAYLGTILKRLQTEKSRLNAIRGEKRSTANTVKIINLGTAISDLTGKIEQYKRIEKPTNRGITNDEKVAFNRQYTSFLKSNRV